MHCHGYSYYVKCVNNIDTVNTCTCTEEFTIIITKDQSDLIIIQ